MLVFLFTPNVSLIELDRAFKLDSFGFPRLAQPMCQMPCRLLCNIQITMQFHTRYALDIGGNQVGCNCPDTITELGAMHYSA